MKLFVSPHNDDEVLFGTFTLLREKPLVLIIFDSQIQAIRGANITAEQRRAETLAAMKFTGCQVKFVGISDAYPTATEAISYYVARVGAEEIYAPAWEANGNYQHNLVAEACNGLPNVTRYMTYTTAGKSTGIPVPFEPEWPLLKLKALACYESQVSLPGCQPHFMREQYEYYAP